MAIYSGFTHWKWWFSIAMLVYQRVWHIHRFWQWLTWVCVQIGYPQQHPTVSCSIIFPSWNCNHSHLRTMNNWKTFRSFWEVVLENQHDLMRSVWSSHLRLQTSWNIPPIIDLFSRAAQSQANSTPGFFNPPPGRPNSWLNIPYSPSLAGWWFGTCVISPFSWES